MFPAYIEVPQHFASKNASFPPYVRGAGVIIALV